MLSKQLSVHIELRKKSKILCPDSAVLTGVIDESGILGPEEVFV